MRGMGALPLSAPCMWGEWGASPHGLHAIGSNRIPAPHSSRENAWRLSCCERDSWLSPSGAGQPAIDQCLSRHSAGPGDPFGSRCALRSMDCARWGHPHGAHRRGTGMGAAPRPTTESEHPPEHARGQASKLDHSIDTCRLSDALPFTVQQQPGRGRASAQCSRAFRAGTCWQRGFI